MIGQSKAPWSKGQNKNLTATGHNPDNAPDSERRTRNAGTLPQPMSESTVNLKCPVWFRGHFKVIMREWAEHLTMQQLAVVMFLFDRTAAWGKEWELVKMRAFVYGISSADGEVRYASGVCSSVSTAERVTSELMDMGVIFKRKSREGNLWALNYKWKEKYMREPRIIKRNPSRMTGSNPSSVTGSNPSCMTDHKYSEAIKGNASQNITLSRLSGREGRSGFSIEDAVAKAKAKTQAAVDRKQAKKKGRMNSVDVARHWTTAVKSAPWLEVGDAITASCYLTKRDAQALKSYTDRFSKSYPKEDAREYLTWLVHQWPGLRTEVFGWMTKCPAPEAPSALFLIKWKDRIEEKYLQRIAFEKRLTLTPEEREVGRLVKSGMSLGNAKAKVHGTEAKSFGGAIRRPYSGGNLVDHPVDKTISITPRSRPFPNRNSNRNHIALPSLGDSAHNDSYED